LSHSGWRDDFASDPNIVGSAVTLDHRPCTVLGVMPPQFSVYPREATLWVVPANADPLVAKPNQHVWAALGRLKPGVSQNAAQAELSAIRSNQDRSDPDNFRGVGAVVLPLQEEYVWLAGRNLSSGLKVLMAGVAFVLLIACLNLANLLLARTAERQRELAVRSAVGCTASRLARQLFTETLLLTLIGAGAGLLLAAFALRSFARLHPIDLPPGADAHIDIRVLIFTTLATLLAGLLCTLLPARLATQVDVETVLRRSSRGASRGVPLAGSLVIIQVSFSVALLVAAALLSESAARMA